MTYVQDLDKFLRSPGLSPDNRSELLVYWNHTDYGRIMTSVWRGERNDQRMVRFEDPPKTMTVGLTRDEREEEEEVAIAGGDRGNPPQM